MKSQILMLCAVLLCGCSDAGSKIKTSQPEPEVAKPVEPATDHNAILAEKMAMIKSDHEYVMGLVYEIPVMMSNAFRSGALHGGIAAHYIILIESNSNPSTRDIVDLAQTMFDNDFIRRASATNYATAAHEFDDNIPALGE